MDDEAFMAAVMMRLDTLERQVATLRRAVEGQPAELELRDRVLSLRTMRKLMEHDEEHRADHLVALDRIKGVSRRVKGLEAPDGKME